jgi:hypothetical protein
VWNISEQLHWFDPTDRTCTQKKWIRKRENMHIDTQISYTYIIHTFTNTHTEFTPWICETVQAKSTYEIQGVRMTVSSGEIRKPLVPRTHLFRNGISSFPSSFPVTQFLQIKLCLQMNCAYAILYSLFKRNSLLALYTDHSTR